MDHDLELEHIEYEHGALLGDPRRCPRHPHVTTSSPDGMFDAPCHICEAEMDEEMYDDQDDRGQCQDDSCDVAHCRSCGDHMPYAGIEQGQVCDSCRRFADEDDGDYLDRKYSR